MKPSTSKYISMESMPLTELFNGEPGATGLYIPAPDDKGSVRYSIARISSAAKRYGSNNGKRSTIQTLVVLRYEGDSDIPVASKMLQITIIDTDKVSDRSKRYVESGGVKNRKPRKKKQKGEDQ